jgi:hypothetical protein
MSASGSGAGEFDVWVYESSMSESSGNSRRMTWITWLLMFLAALLADVVYHEWLHKAFN